MSLLLHGTTVATNALLTCSFPRAAMVTTAGFRDVIEIRRGTNENIWDAYADVAPPPILRRDRFEVRERIDAAGNVLVELSLEDAERVARTIAVRGIDTTAVCFVVDVLTIGAGGGSIASVDAGGSLRCGPESAGSTPGPACYALDGNRPTVTDANLVLGRLGESLAGGSVPLDVGLAREAIRGHVAEPLQMSVEEAAQAVIAVSVAKMADAVRVMSVRGGS